jgi:hypothetical protein
MACITHWRIGASLLVTSALARIALAHRIGASHWRVALAQCNFFKNGLIRCIVFLAQEYPA